MRIPELQVAMPVRAAADGQAQALSDARESPLGAGGVARVTHLEAVETLFLELADLAVRAVVAEVSGDGDATDRVHQLGDLLQRRERLLDVRRPAPAQIARKGFVHVDAYARRATSAGAYSPSDAVEWQCRSTRAVGTLRRGPGRLGLPEQVDELPLGELSQRGVGTATAHGRVAAEATAALGAGPLLEHHAELVAVVHRHAPRRGHLPRLPVDDDRPPRHGRSLRLGGRREGNLAPQLPSIRGVGPEALQPPLQLDLFGQARRLGAV